MPERSDLGIMKTKNTAEKKGRVSFFLMPGREKFEKRLPQVKEMLTGMMGISAFSGSIFSKPCLNSPHETVAGQFAFGENADKTA